MINNLTYKDIRQRSRDLTTDTYVSKSTCNVKYLYDTLRENYSYKHAKTILENWRDLSKHEIDAFDKVLEVFGIVCDNDNISNIKNAANIIEGNIVHKVRDGKATRHLNNYKLGKLKIQNTKVLNHTKDNTSSVGRAMKNGGSVGNTLHPNRKYKYDIYGKRVGEVKKSSSGEDNNNESDEKNKEKEETVKECVERFIKAAWTNDQCDRVLDNHSKLTRKFNLDSMVRSCPIDESSITECIYELCQLIDTYEAPFGVKYNIALENILYLMKKNCVDISNQTILESVTDYFLLSRDTTPEMLHDMNYILENTKFYSDEDVKCLSYLKEDSNDIIQEQEADENNMDLLLLSESKDEKEKSKGKEKIQQLIKDFKKSNKKTIESLKHCITRIFVNSPENIIGSLPDIFVIVRAVAVIGMIAIHPLVGIIGIITGYFLKMNISRKEMAKVIEQYRKEKKKYKKKMDESKDEKTKEKYKALVKKFEEDIAKLEDYEDTLYSEKENEKRTEEKYARDAEDDLDNDDLDLDWDFDNFDESTQYQINMVDKMAVLVENMNWDPDDLMKSISRNIKSTTAKDIYDITESVVLCNNVFNCTQYSNILEDELLHSRSLEGLSKYEKIDAIHNSMREVNKVKYDDLLEQVDYEDIPIDIVYEQTRSCQEVVDDTIELVSRYTLNEGKDNSGISISSKLKLAKEGLKNTAMKLKQKDKELSNKVDATMGSVSNAAERALRSENREAVIKGQLLPSASKCIKLAITTGAAWLVSPAIAVIGVLGYVGASKKMQKKERQLILDDIEIELEMCEKYLRIAEDKNDMKAVRSIMQTKRALQRQQQRLKYNYVVKWDGNAPKSVKPTHDED